MRPDPQEHQTEDASDRIIYLGDVRRRRASRRRSPDTHYLAVFAVMAAGGWAAWLIVLLSLPPSRLLTYLAFFTPFWIALTSTSALVAYGYEWRREGFASLRVAGRRGALLATVVVLNLGSLAAHHWSLALGAASVLAAVGLDALLMRRVQ